MTSADRYPVSGPVTRQPDHQYEAAMNDLAFGTAFTDHMARAVYHEGAGWGERALIEFGPLTLSPATSVLHYGQEIFEGLKAYRHADGAVYLFRPEENARRFNRSAERLALPLLPEEDFIGSIEALVRADQRWIPTAEGASLYLRPFAFASEAFLGVRPSREVTYLVIASPVGPYFKNGFQPVSIWVSTTYRRACPGGTGAAKTSGNYAASLLPQSEGVAGGCEQVCFLDAVSGTKLDELGGMNVMVVHQDGTVVTPRTDGNILEGVTRSSIMQLLRDHGHQVVEGDIVLTELLEDVRSGEVTEVFACGTAAVITPIGRLASTGFDVTVAGGKPGPVTSRTFEALTAIQYGQAEDRHGWLHRVPLD